MVLYCPLRSALKQAQAKTANSREVFGSDLSREVCYMRLPCPRVRLSCKPRHDKFFKTAESPSTSDCCYSHVPLLQQENLPRIARDQKTKIMDLKQDAPPSWNSSAVPLFWTEGFLVLLE